MMKVLDRTPMIVQRDDVELAMRTGGDMLDLIAGIGLAGVGIVYLIGALLLQRGYSTVAKHIGPTIRGNMFRGLAFLIAGLLNLGRKIVPDGYALLYAGLSVAFVVVFGLLLFAAQRIEVRARKPPSE